jgi:two-component system, cell cycle response regulator CpdR
VLPPEEIRNFGTFLICGQLWDKPLLVSNNHIGCPDVKHNRDREIKVTLRANAGHCGDDPRPKPPARLRHPDVIQSLKFREGVREELPLPRVVLVVDDEPMVLHVAATVLEDLGCEVVTAHGGNDALRKLSADDRIEILMTDINMPGMDGYELAEKARDIRKGLKVIVLSGRPHTGRGFPLIQKPFSKGDLKRTMFATSRRRRGTARPNDFLAPLLGELRPHPSPNAKCS